MAFLDTNVLIYAASGRPTDARKTRVARSLAADTGHEISLQVLQEFYVAARHPNRLGFTHHEAEAYCRQWRRFTVLEPTLLIFEDALAICVQFQLGYYDAAIVAAARFLKSDILYSEDLNDGQNYDGVRVQNPFRDH